MIFRSHFISLVFFLVGGFLLGFWSHSFQDGKNTPTPLPVNSLASSGNILSSSGYTTEKTVSRLIDKRIENAYSILEKNYYHFSESRVSDIQDGIIKGIVNSLQDKHSEFLTADETKDFNMQLSGDFEGIGAVIDAYDNGVIVERVLDDSPAKDAGIVRGDVILSANGTPLRDMLPSEAVKHIRGPANSVVELMVQKYGVGEERKLSLTRRKINIPSVREEILTGVTQTGNIGYIDLSIFGEDTAHDFEKALIQIKESRAQGLIIDLRQNGGGLLDSAIDILSHFVPKDKALVTTKENNPKDNMTLFSHGSPISFSLPVVILLDSHSASASEIVAGALQDYRQAIIVGETSYGKGSVQQPFPLEDGSELKITVARWFTPYDRGIDGKGITPDISVKMTLQDYEKGYDREFEEAKKVLVRWIENRDRDATIKEFSASGKILESSGSTLSGQILPEKQQ